jgi:2-keto-4-pentenoate hydratase/2-oxohepta-3-ene-1,7-dioic acid hydratase in catechol pathway
MRIVRYGEGQYGAVEGDVIHALTAAPWETGGIPAHRGDSVDRRTAALLPPTVPTKILGIGRNYRAHAQELGNEVPKEPLVFYKPPSSLLAHNGLIQIPADAGRVDFEGELALVISRRACHVPAESWRDVVFGFTVANDVTARELQKKDGQWWRAKGMDTFCPLGPAIETDLDPFDLLLETFVDGEKKQSGRTSDMIFPLPELIAYVTRYVTLEPGDVILTGTPEGVAPLVPGQTVEIQVDGIGCLSAKVTSRD